MKKSLFLLLTLFVSLTLSAQQKVIVRFNQPDQQTLKTFTKPGNDVAAYKPGSYLDIVIPEREFGKLVSQGYDVQIIKTESEMAANLGNVDDIDGYRTYDEALQELQQIADDNPDICMLMDIGDSHGKVYYESNYGNYANYQHDIWALKVSDNVTENEDEPAIYYFGAHHAREPLSTEMNFKIINHIIDNYGTDPEITENVNTKEIWFVPIVNPDGHEVVLNQIDLNWRKNIRDNDGDGQVTPGAWQYPDGVDPNRNYGWEWGGDGASSDPSDETYCGPEAFSEPELQAIRDLMAAEHFVAGISYHTYSELVLWPYGYANGAIAPDADAIGDLGTMMGEAIPALYGGHYTPEPSWQLYPAAGITDDWAYGMYGTFGYTIEMATEFIPSASQVQQITQDNLDAAMILLNRVNYSTLTGHITDASNGEPVVGEIYIDGIDNTGMPREPYKSNEEFGTYYRMLMDGNYTVTFSAFGYVSQTFDNVTITEDGQTVLDVQLEPSEIVSLSGTVTDADSGDPIEGAEITLLNTPVDPVFTNENGEYQISEIFENTYTFKVYAQDYATLIQVVNIDPENNVADFELMESFAVSFESGYFDPGWTFSGNADWTIDDNQGWDGSSSARSGSIGDQSTSEMIYTQEDGMAGQVSFYRKVSSESGYDYLRFYIDDQLQDEWAGELDWDEVSYTVDAGTHAYKWVYEKDYSVSNGDDCGWIDYVTFPPAAGVNAQAGPNGEFCAGETYQCQGEASYYETVVWTTAGDGTFSDDAILDPVYTPGSNDITNGSVTLTLTASDGNGNDDSDNLELTIDPVPAQGTEVSGPAAVCAGNTESYNCTDIPNADDCEWMLTPETAGTIEFVSQNEIMVTWSEGYYDEASLQVRGMNDCGYGDYSDALVVSVEDCTGLEEYENAAVRVFPNPAGNVLSVASDVLSMGNAEITMINIFGETVLEVNMGNSTRISTIDVSSLPEGVYFVEVKSPENNFIKKIVIKR